MICQIPLIDYFKQHFENIQWKKNIVLPISSISSNFLRKKLKEIAIFQFFLGAMEEIHFFRKKNNPADEQQH